MPQVQAVIIGLTEGTMELSKVSEFLRQANVSERWASEIAQSVANIPIGAQAALPNFKKRPKIGDLYKEKTDTWPVDPNTIKVSESNGKKPKPGTGAEWL